LSDEKSDEYANGQITESFLKANIPDFDQQFYVCGPPPMMDAVQKQLADLGVRKVDITVEEM